MKIHCIGVETAALAWQCHVNGCQVMAHLGEGRIGAGFGFPLLPTPQITGRADAVLVHGHGQAADELERTGMRVIGGGKWADVLAHPQANRAALLKIAPHAEDAQSTHSDMLIGGWWDRGWRKPFFAAVERWALFAGNIGPRVAPMGMEAMPVSPDEADVADVLARLSTVVGELPYRGPLALRFAVDDSGPGAVLAIHAGADVMLLACLAEMVYGGLPALLSEAGAESSGDCAVAVTLSVPPWPYGGSGQPVDFAVPPVVERHFWPLACSKTPGAWRYEGAGAVGIVSARGRAGQGDKRWLSEAAWRAYRSISNLQIEDVQYRNDIGSNAQAATGLTAASHPTDSEQPVAACRSSA